MNWYNRLKTAQNEIYGYWVTPDGTHYAVKWMEHAEVAHRVLGGPPPRGVEDYEAPYRAGWWRLVTHKDASASGPRPATTAQARKAVDLLMETKRPQFLIEIGGNFAFVPVEYAEMAMTGRRPLKKMGPIR